MNNTQREAAERAYHHLSNKLQRKWGNPTDTAQEDAQFRLEIETMTDEELDTSLEQVKRQLGYETWKPYIKFVLGAALCFLVLYLLGAL